jgi:hypothetical protein
MKNFLDACYCIGKSVLLIISLTPLLIIEKIDKFFEKYYKDFN